MAAKGAPLTFLKPTEKQHVLQKSFYLLLNL